MVGIGCVVMLSSGCVRSSPVQTEDLTALAAQQYYVEYGLDLNAERLATLVPGYIPDALLQGSGAIDKWTQMIINSYKKVRARPACGVQPTPWGGGVPQCHRGPSPYGRLGM